MQQMPTLAQAQAQTGAVLNRSNDGQVLGAVGASGGYSDADELSCIAGVESFGLTAA